MTFSSKVIAALVLSAMAGVGLLSYWGEVRNEEDRQWVTHTMAVVEKLQAIRIDITRAEAGQRGYLLTGEESYLETYQAGLDELHGDMEELRQLTSDNPVRQEAILRLDPLIAAREAELSGGIIGRQKSGLSAGVEVAYRDTGGKWMQQIGEQIGEMREKEGQLLSRRLETAASSTRKMKVVIIGGNALTILILLVKGFVIHWEIRARKLAEQHLKEVNRDLTRRTMELSETNVELESFSYSVAHDLRAPLRQIAGFSRVLVQDHGPRLDAEAQRCLEKVDDGARKMGRLVDDLLSLSKIGRQELEVRLTPLDALLRQVVEELEPQCSGREVEWRIGELPSAECDPGLMKQVFVNLLSNAVKYTGKRERAVIQVGQAWQDDRRVIFVRDNGVGFEMQYVGKLFGVFQRLHKARDFEGTGVGLAIVQRIIRKHGGRIWAEAKVDEGATFFFTLGSPETSTSQEMELPIKDEVMHV
jgi:signal transduction histidine kinase